MSNVNTVAGGGWQSEDLHDRQPWPHTDRN